MVAAGHAIDLPSTNSDAVQRCWPARYGMVKST
jgi:hypothetical protein